MKTPREILFERHRAAEPKLDAVRETALASLAQAPARTALREQDSPNLAACLRERLLSFRWHFAALGAAWLVVLLLSIDHSPVSVPAIASQSIPSPRQLSLALRENRRQLLELIEVPVADRSAVPHTVAPRRRSELQPCTVVA
jgi:hypothetical protein